MSLFFKKKCPVLFGMRRMNQNASLLHRFPDCRLPTLALIHASVRREPVLFINESHRPSASALI